MSIIKYRLFNINRWIFIVTILLGLFIFFFVSSGLFDVTIGFNSSALDISDNASSVQQKLIRQILTLDNYTDVLGFSSTVIPIMIFFSVTCFFDEINSLFIYEYNRVSNSKKLIIHTLLFYSFLNAVVVYILYLIYFLIGYIFIGNNIEIPRNAFDGIFGAGFGNYPIYFVVEAIIPYFIGTLIYTFFACAVSFFVNHKYQCILIPIIYYWGSYILIEFIRSFMTPQLASIFVKFQPMFIYGYQSYIYENPSILTVINVLDSLLLPLVIGIILLIIKLKKGRDWC